MKAASKFTWTDGFWQHALPANTRLAEQPSPKPGGQKVHYYGD